MRQSRNNANFHLLLLVARYVVGPCRRCSIGRAALEGFSSLDKKLAAFYTDIMYSAINEAARRALEGKMKGYVFTRPFAVEIFQNGLKQGRDEDAMKVSSLLPAH